ncbi:MAG: DUF3857 domain-containing protein [Verrucomicrobia bacterium]|nr:DUF3857 domain-containing protein [Verrucomicrobiota bacterium]
MHKAPPQKLNSLFHGSIFTGQKENVSWNKTATPQFSTSSFFDLSRIFWGILASLGLGFAIAAYQNIVHAEEKKEDSVAIDRKLPEWTASAQNNIDIVWKEQPNSNPNAVFIEESINLQTHTQFYRYVRYVDDADDLEDFNLPSFDPTVQTCTVHSLNVISKKGKEDRLSPTAIKLKTHEEDDFIDEGEKGIEVSLDNLQEGDMVEISFSIQGEHKRPSPLFSGAARANDAEQSVYRIVTGSQRSLSFKAFNTSALPKKERLSDTLDAYTWQPPRASYNYENYQPMWYDSKPRLEVSEFKNWNEVVKAQLPLFTLPKDFVPTDEMKTLVTKWKEESKGDPYVAATLALTFVQDEIEFENDRGGKWNFTPFPPEGTMSVRYGNCRDKSLLLHTLLGMMGINSQLALTDFDENPKLPESLPGYHVFDHTLLRISIEGKHYWVEPIDDHRGGDIKTRPFSGYEYALVLDPTTNDLTPCPPNKEMLAKTVIETAVKVDTTAQKVFFSCSTHMFGAYADAMRSDIEDFKEAKTAFSSSFLPHLNNGKYTIEKQHPIDISDDRHSNELILRQRYDLLPVGLDKEFELTPSSFTQKLREDYYGAEKRTAPFKLPSGGLKEVITIEGTTIAPLPSSRRFGNDFMRYTEEATQNGDQTKLTREVEYLKGYFPAKSKLEYAKMLGQIRTTSPIIKHRFGRTF